MALEAGLAVPDDARWLVMYPAVDFDFGGVRSTVIQPHFPSYEALTAAGHDVQTIQPEDRYDVAVVCVTRSKAHTRDLIARAASLADLVIVDGQKTDGIESHYKAVRGRADVAGTLTKAHGRMFWFKSMDLEDWHCGPSQVEGGFQTLPGVFSTDAPDPGSALLADALPEVLGKTVADLGAGWGYLSRHILERASVEALHLVEADQRALDCAQINIQDTRAQFHWADATRWSGRYDTVVMNPPFHQGRKATPDLGQAFIQAAALCLKPKGALWMVCNRQLPYEATLDACFRKVEDKGGNGGFKLFRACHPIQKTRNT